MDRISLLRIAVFTACVCFVFGDIVWKQTMDQQEIPEVAGIEKYKDDWKKHIYTLLAVNDVDNSPAGIVYGFKDDAASNPYTIIDTQDHFRIENTTGKVFFHGSRLDFEDRNDRKVKVDMIAKFNDNSQWAKQSSTVLLTDVNDNTPYFANDSLTFSIEENTQAAGGIRVLSYINIKDDDITLSNGQKYLQVKIDYCIIKSKNEPCDDTFMLQPRKLSPRDYLTDFFVMKELDFEKAETFQVQLQITDGLNVDTSDITVTVIDVQDEPPRWKKISAITNTFDGVQPFQMETIMIAEDPDTSKRPIHYELLPGDNKGITVNKIFEIGNSSGIITNKMELDLEDTTYFYSRSNPKIRRDIWTLGVKACEILVELAVPVVGDTALECIETTIKVVIKDVNDNSPLHEITDLYVYELYEDAENRQLLHDPQITIFDTDTANYARFHTEFLVESDVFRVGGTDKTPVIQVKNSTLIDYDLGPKQYDLTLITTDIEDNQLTSTAKVQIHILDTNDNSPKFSQKVYNNTYIPEDLQEAEPVIKIQATDIDSGIFGTIGLRYELTGGHARLFQIDELSGQVTVARCDTYGVAPCLDYDISPTLYTLFVTAYDTKRGPNARRSTVQLEVQLLDVNDNKPQMPNYDESILEGRVHFEPPFSIVATDKDKNSVLSYSILTQTPGNFWTINERTGEIFVNKPSGDGIKFTDGDILGKFKLDVRVSDSKYFAQSRVSITVIDQNDNSPKFFPSHYEISINETIPSGSFVLNLLATDKDDPTSNYGLLKYYLQSGNIGGKFTLDGNTGSLIVTPGAQFDYDTTKKYQMIAIVNDQGQPQLSDFATIIIHILDNNNKDPSIIPFMQWMSCFDNAQPGYTVGNIAGYDPDFDAELVYEWFGTKEANSEEGFEVDPDLGYDFRNLFAVDAQGKVTVSQKLDSKRASLVSYGVIVYDITPTPRQSGTGTILINILPFNVDPPTIEPYPSPIYIDEEQPLGYVIMSIIARDNNGIKLFSISEQPDDFVIIDPLTGSVSINDRINYDDARMYNSTYFKVIVLDTGVPQLSTSASVSVIFRNINDNFPEFMDPITHDPVSIYTYRIPENSPNGTRINVVYAFDEDRPDNNTFHEVRYYMDDNRFDVDPMTGQIFVRLLDGAVLDRETNSHIYVRVIARDNPKGPAENQKQRAASVQVTLTDMNDNPPRFTSDEYIVTIFERIAIDTVILQLFSIDADIGNNKISFYTKIEDEGTDTQNFFDVKKERGFVYVKKSLRHHVGRYKFYVQATDNLGTGLTANTTVIVIVQPSANNVPVWFIPPIANMTIPILEEQYNGMLVFDVSARDTDNGLNGIVEYSFIYNGVVLQKTPEFRINKITGVIQAEIVYDREKVDKYVLLLMARDRGDTPLETTRFLTVEIIDVNDNAPIFDDREVQVDVNEDQQLGNIKTIPSATDLDINPLIVYDIISGNEGEEFELDRYNRMLRLVKPLDRESKGVFYMDVQASNDEADYTVIRSRRRRATDPSIITIKVVVGNINDLAPAFLQDEYYGCVTSRSPYDKHILQVQAIDRDAIGTGVVRYTVTNGNKIGNLTLFDIHPRSGVITNKVLMRRYADSTFFVTVNARDREDSATAESADTVAKIFVNQPTNEVKLLLTQNTGEVRLYQSQVQRIIEGAPDLDYVCINEIKDHDINTVGSVTTLWSDMYVSGIRREVIDGVEKYTILSSMEFSNIITREMNERNSDFDLLYIKNVEAASSSNELELDESAILIITIIIAVLIFLVMVFCILAFLCIRQEKRQKKAKLLHRTHATPPPMISVVENEPVVVEPVVYDNRAYVREQEPVVIAEPHVIEYDPVHVQYAVVQKRSPSPQLEQLEYVVQDDQDVIVVELQDDGPQPSVDYQSDPEYIIETDLLPDKM